MRPVVFQSAPAQMSGRYQWEAVKGLLGEVFQSAPAQMSGRYQEGLSSVMILVSFNPRPLK